MSVLQGTILPPIFVVAAFLVSSNFYIFQRTQIMSQSPETYTTFPPITPRYRSLDPNIAPEAGRIDFTFEFRFAELSVRYHGNKHDKNRTRSPPRRLPEQVSSCSCEIRLRFRQNHRFCLVRSRLCNRRRCVAPVLNDFYVGTYLIMFLSWQKHAATVSDTGHILQGNIASWPYLEMYD